jgi:hypothetical protein
MLRPAPTQRTRSEHVPAPYSATAILLLAGPFGCDTTPSMASQPRRHFPVPPIGRSDAASNHVGNSPGLTLSTRSSHSQLKVAHLDAEVTEFQRICQDVAKWRQRRHATVCSHTSPTKSHPCTRLASSDTFLEIEHAWTDCPLDPQRLARLNGTTDDRAGGFGYLDIGNTHSARAGRKGRARPRGGHTQS